jgi:hypothetical protein
MSDLLDKSLDDLIATREAQGGRGGKRGGGRKGGAPREPKASSGAAAERVITVVKRPSQETSGPARRTGGERGRRQQEALPYKREVVRPRLQTSSTRPDCSPTLLPFLILFAGLAPSGGRRR